MPHNEDENGGEYASPPCLLHELDPSYAGLTIPKPPDQAEPRRKSERKRSIRQRQAKVSDRRRQ